jgi:hypothetical protein
MINESMTWRTIGTVALSSACTTLGPMPATTGASFAPATRPDVTLSAGVMPGYYLSSSVQQEGKGTSIGQASLLVEPDRWIDLPGAVIGGRYVGEDDNGGYPEPLVGYRAHLGEEKRLALGGLLYGTRGSGASKRASYRAWRVGGELGSDFRVTPQSHWLELHVFGSAALTGLSAEGKYCLDEQLRYGVDCGEMQEPVDAEANGFYASVDAGLGFELARHLESVFHGLRLDLHAGAGTMPALAGAAQTSARTYSALGAALGVSLGGE